MTVSSGSCFAQREAEFEWVEDDEAEEGTERWLENRLGIAGPPEPRLCTGLAGKPASPPIEALELCPREVVDVVDAVEAE